MRTVADIADDLRSLSDRIDDWHKKVCGLGCVALTAKMTKELAELCATVPLDLKERFNGLSGAFAKVLLDDCPLEETPLAEELWQLLDELEKKLDKE